MKETTMKLLTQLRSAHDWEEGKTFSNGGTEIHSTDVCRVCSLRWHSSSDSQNGVQAHDRFSDGETGQSLSLRQALKRGCMGEEIKTGKTV